MSRSNSVRWTASCQNDSIEWGKLLHRTFPDELIDVIDGFYYPNGNYENGEGHTWIEVNGSIFDPVGDIFDDYPNLDSSYYEETGPNEEWESFIG